MKAMIFAAGNGTRLKDETNSKPKALVDINGKTLLELCIEKLKLHGIDEIVINVHHYAQQIIDFLYENKNFDLKIHISDERNELLDTGGGLVKARHFFNENEDILIHNVDILSSIDLSAMIKFHQKSDSLVTIAVKDRETQRKLLFDKNLRLSGWKNFATGEEIISRKQNEYIDLAYTGTHVINARIFDLITNTGKFSVFKSYLELSKFHNIYAFVHNEDTWLDVGKPETLELARKSQF